MAGYTRIRQHSRGNEEQYPGQTDRRAHGGAARPEGGAPGLLVVQVRGLAGRFRFPCKETHYRKAAGQKEENRNDQKGPSLRR